MTLRHELEERLAGRSAPDRRALFVGILNKHLPTGVRAVLVGGALVEFYTRGLYVTGDVGLVSDKEPVRQVLRGAGFEEQGRYLFRDDLGIVAEVPSRWSRPTEVVVEAKFEGYAIPMVTVEDAIVDRLLAAQYWRSSTDWEQAILLFGAQRASIDLVTLREKAKRNQVREILEELLAAAPTTDATKDKPSTGDQRRRPARRQSSE